MFDDITLYFKGYRDPFSKAECYENGTHVSVNFTKALTLYRQAMAQGDARGYYRIGRWYQAEGNVYRSLTAYYGGAVRNHGPSRQALEVYVAEENVEAIFLLGMVMARNSNWERAIALYNQAANMEHPDAMFNLGRIYHRGITGTVTIEIDLNVALGWYRRAADNGSKYALNELVVLSSENGEAEFNLAEMYRLGQGGLYPHMERAVEVYGQSSEFGEPRASFYLGQLYENGADSVDPNRLRSFSYYALAARQEHPNTHEYLTQQATEGDADAQYALGYHYYREIENIREAVRWCVMAEMREHAEARTYLTLTEFDADILFLIAAQYDADEANLLRNTLIARDFYVRATKLNETRSAFCLGRLYENGKGGLEQNRSKAFRFYARSARQEYTEAKERLEQLVALGDAEAQYAYGYHYHRKLNAVAEAVRFCVMAEMQGHELALDYLTKTKFDKSTLLQIAHQYEADTINPGRSTSRALEFYVRIAELGDSDIAFYLAQFYQVSHVGVVKNLTLSFDFYVRAARLGDQDARIPLERLGEEVSADKQMELSCICFSFFSDEERATYWREKANEARGIELRV